MANVIRAARAHEAIEAHKKQYYDKGCYKGADFWDFAEIYEIIVDAAENIGDKDGEFTAMFAEMYDFAITEYGRTWEKNPFNDDIMWLCIALTRAYMLTGERRYLNTAIENFDLTWERAYSSDLGGGLFWRVENQSKNVCVNCPGSIAASLIAKATGNDAYYEKASLALEWVAEKMYEPEVGKVYDALDIDNKVHTWSSTYNQGTFIGSNMLMYEHTGDSRYLERAKKAAGYVIGTMYNGGIMNNEEPGNDLPGFKGILARWLYRFAVKTGDEKALEWLRLNAESAWSNRNSLGIMWTQLAKKTEERDDYDVFAVSAAVSVLVNSI